jgi:DnaJ-class molecular chaperone
VLGDPEKRKKYDELGANWRAYEQQGPQGQPGGPGGPWAGPFGQAGGGSYRTMTPEEMQEMFGGAGGDDPFSDFFHTFFGGATGGTRTGGRRGRAARATRGSDFQSPVDLTLEEAFSGTTRRLQVETRQGGGTPRTIEVRIPAGVKDGARVRVSGEGERAPKGGSAGDLYLVVHLVPHPRFERHGADLRTHVDVPVTTAVLGGEVPVETLGDSTLRLKIPPHTTGGRVFRMRRHGMPVVGKPDERGDLYATVDITIPDSLSDEARQHYEALRDLERKVHS